MQAQQARQMYGAINKGVQTPRNIEYQAFARITQRLQQAVQKPQKKSDMIRALHENRRLWTLLATDLAREGNKLGQQLRADLLSLAAFSLTQSSRAIKNPDLIASLIDVNTSMMKGLRGDLSQ